MSLGYATYLLSGNFRTPFGPIDDHEPLSWLETDSSLPLSGVLHVLLNRTEIGNFGDTVRFRPAYYFVRASQASLLGDNPTLWYASSFAIFVLTVALLGVLTWLWVSLGIGRSRPHIEYLIAFAVPVVGVILFGSLRAWTGVIARLGPSELLAILGLTLVLLASTLLVVSSSSWWWLPALIGNFLAVGSKENFLPIVLVPVGVGLFRFARTRRARGLIPVAVSLLTMFIVVLGVSSTAGLNGTDVYGRTVGVARATSALTELFGTYAAYWIPGALLLLASLLLWSVVYPRPSRDVRVLVVFCALNYFLLLFFDAWTYRGVYEMVRYWMVFDFLKVLGIVAAVALLVGVLMNRQGMAGRGFALIALIAALSLASLQMVAVPQSASAIRDEVRANALAASTWSEGVSRVIREVGTLDQPQVLVIPSGPIDFEPVVALTRALRRASLDNSVFVVVGASAAVTPDGAPTIKVLQNEGWPDPEIQPFSGFDRNGEVLCVFLNGEPREMRGCVGARSVTVRARGI